MSYKVYQMSEIDDCTTHLSDIDAFICFDVAEDRSLNALLKLNEKSNLNTAMVITLGTAGASPASKGLNAQNLVAEFVNVDKNLSSSIIPCLQMIEKYVNGKKSLGIDISSMPIPYIAQILHFLHRKHESISLTIYYTEPSHYNLNNLFEFSSFSGEIDIRTVPGYEGETSQVGEVKRVVFYLMGFEMTYLSKLIPQDVNPNEIAPINGFPSYFPKYKDISLINNDTNFYAQDIEIVYSEANNPFEAYNTMVVLANKFDGFRIDIIPVGTKPMALGACMFALNQGDSKCRIIFPFPADYRPNQSTGCGKLWEYKL